MLEGAGPLDPRLGNGVEDQLNRHAEVEGRPEARGSHGNSLPPRLAWGEPRLMIGSVPPQSQASSRVGGDRQNAGVVEVGPRDAAQQEGWLLTILPEPQRDSGNLVSTRSFPFPTVRSVAD